MRVLRVLRPLVGIAIVAWTAATALAAPSAPLAFKSRYVRGQAPLSRAALLELGPPANRAKHMSAQQYRDLSMAIRTILKGTF